MREPSGRGGAPLSPRREVLRIALPAALGLLSYAIHRLRHCGFRRFFRDNRGGCYRLRRGFFNHCIGGRQLLHFSGRLFRCFRGLLLHCCPFLGRWQLFLTAQNSVCLCRFTGPRRFCGNRFQHRALLYFGCRYRLIGGRGNVLSLGK